MQPATALPAVEHGARSDPGRDPNKQVNEDVWGTFETKFGHLCLVCDGMGGHAAGREAAELAMATIVEVFESAPEWTPNARVLRSAIEEANRRVKVVRTSEIGFGRPGSTVVPVLMHAQGTDVAHVGDSRAYLIHEGQVLRLTKDHSIVEELVDRGLITPEQAARHPDANRITRALGISEEVEVDLRAQPVHHVTGDTFVLCSDGLSDLVEDHEILAMSGAEPPAQAAAKLVDLANSRGGHDNVTVLVLRARESVARSAAATTPTVPQTGVPPSRPRPAAHTVPDRTSASPRPAAHTLPDRTSASPRPAAHTLPDRTSAGAPSHAPYANRPLDSPAAPVASRPPLSRPASCLLLVAILIASAALALLVVALVSHFAEGSGKRNAVAEGGLVADAAAPLPDALSPGSVIVPSTIPAVEPIAPLEPMGPEPHRKKRPR
jgi:protein phosphatase